MEDLECWNFIKYPTKKRFRQEFDKHENLIINDYNCA